MTPASASSPGECSFLSVKVNGVWTSEKRVGNSSISRSTSLSKTLTLLQEKSSIIQNNIDIDKLNFIISKLENVDQQNVNQNYINTLVTDNGQVILDSALS
jgi:hypothetical protein